VPGITFDQQGQCSLCQMQDRLALEYPTDEKGAAMLEKKLAAIREQGKNKKYDCILGISGGRDSTYLLYLAVTKWKLRPLAVNFNDGFGNPIAGENMLKAIKKLDVPLRTISADFRECKDLKIADLKSSTPMHYSTDTGVGASLFGVAYREGVKHILFGQSFRTEGIRPLSWAYFDGDYLRAVHKQFGKLVLRKWKPEDPGYNLGIKEMFFYVGLYRIRVHSPLNYYSYVRPEAEEIIKRELEWVYPGAHYYDDLYWSLITYIHRVKFNINFRLIEYSALIRSGQMERETALQRASVPYKLEDPEVISLCIKRLGITQQQFDTYLSEPPRNFWDYPNSYDRIRLFQFPVWLLSKAGLFPQVAYDKYFLMKFK
jgi:hypothetical protein